MDAFLHQFQHLKIQLEEITSATNDFDDKMNYIGGGGFGKVYKGEFSHSKGRSMAAIKRLDPKHGQGIPEFLKEITTLSRYSHENLISLLGFCYHGNEMILVYEHASRGSLDSHLSSPHLTWSQHEHLNAKVSDFGLSIMGPANEQHSVIVTSAAGTPGYCDPQYAMSHTLTKESDIYSFGVVLFGVLCGTLCCTYGDGRVEKKFMPKWIESCEQKKLNSIIFKSPTIKPLDRSSLEIVSNIAYRCLKESREDRPKMAEVLIELESALERQLLTEGKLPCFFLQKIAKIAEPPLHYTSKAELKQLMYKGVLLNNGKTWFSINKKGEHCEMISFAECLNSDTNNSWFAAGSFRYNDGKLETHVKSRFLSLLTTYTVNLVFKFRNLASKWQPIYLKYILQGETKTLVSCLAYEREDGWLECELFQFTSDSQIVDLEILFNEFEIFFDSVEVEGIEFRPLEKVEHKDENQTISDSDAYWEEKLPTDYEDIMKWSTDIMQWTTKKEAYSIIRKGFLIDDGEKWFFLNKNGKKCHMLSVAYIESSNKHHLHLYGPRFFLSSHQF
ncbi:hypothetical protein R6Q57_006684 [Mikania cordata]